MGSGLDCAPEGVRTFSEADWWPWWACAFRPHGTRGAESRRCCDVRRASSARRSFDRSVVGNSLSTYPRTDQGLGGGREGDNQIGLAGHRAQSVTFDLALVYSPPRLSQ